MARSPQGLAAVVTGSSTGIGRAIAERLAEQGAPVVINYARRAEPAMAAVSAIEAKGARAIALQADMGNVDSIRRLFDQAEEQLGPIGTVVANAGMAEYKPLIDFSEADFDRMFALNARGTFFVLQEAARRVADGGRIIVISSSATRMAAPTASVYSGSKAAAEQFALSLAKELGDRHVCVNVVSPGFTDTEMLAEVGEQYREVGAQMSPFKRLGKPQDIADVVAFLASDQARWLTGQNIQAGGGVVSAA